MIYNISEVVHSRSKLTEPEKIEKFLSDGKKSLETLQKISKLDATTLKVLFETLEKDGQSE